MKLRSPLTCIQHCQMGIIRQRRSYVSAMKDFSSNNPFQPFPVRRITVRAAVYLICCNAYITDYKLKELKRYTSRGSPDPSYCICIQWVTSPIGFQCKKNNNNHFQHGICFLLYTFPWSSIVYYTTAYLYYVLYPLDPGPIQPQGHCFGFY